MARVVLGESKVRARRRRRRALVALGFVLGLALVFCTLVWAAHASFLRITTVTVAGAGAVGTQTVQNFVMQDLAGDYLGILPKNNVLLYPKGVITADLLSKFPTLRTASVGAANLHILTVSVAERQPTALWCGERQASSSDCFLLDQDGLAYVPSAEFSGNAYYQYYGALGKDRHFVTPAQFHDLVPLINALGAKESDLTVASVYVDPESDVHVAFTNGFTLIFALADVGHDVYQRFTLALQADPFVAHPVGDFEYLDLRFGDKLYYKLKTE